MWLDFVFALLLPSNNEQLVVQEVAIIIAYPMKYLHVNFREIIEVQIWWKARQHNDSTPFLDLISHLFDQGAIQYFNSDKTVPTGGVIDRETERVQMP